MSFARGYGLNGKSVFMNVAKPMECFLNFVVDSTNGNGLGIRSLKSNGYVEKVFMYSTHAASGNGNPNWVGPSNMFPSANPLTTSTGLIIVQMKQNFNHFIGSQIGCVSPTTGAALKIDNGATLTIGNAYIIASVGNASAAQWATLGVPAGVTPAVGLPFVALATGAGSGNTSTSRVIAVGVSDMAQVEAVGDANQAISTGIGQFAGQILVFQMLAPAASTSVMTPTQPADGSVISMRLTFDGSTVSIDGI